MNRFARLLRTTLLATSLSAATLVASLPASAPAAAPSGESLALAFAAASTPLLAAHGDDAQLLARGRSQRSSCVRWWTCGPFKKERPRFA